MAAEAAVGVNACNKHSFGCSAAALGKRIVAIQGFPFDLPPNFQTAACKENHQKELAALAEQCKKWQQGGNYDPGSAVFCLLTKSQLDAKRVLEECGFEELGRTISSHLWGYGGYDMDGFVKTLDAPEMIYLMGKGWYHKEK